MWLNVSENEQNVTKKLNEMSLDIREVLTTLNHFNEKFTDTNKELKEIKDTSKENQIALQKLNLDVNTHDSDIKEVKDDVEIIFSKFRERDKKTDNDRKWLVGTVISVVVLFISIIGLIININ